MSDLSNAVKNEAFFKAYMANLKLEMEINPEGALASLRKLAENGVSNPEVIWVEKGGRVAIKGLGKGQPWGATPDRWNLIFSDGEKLLNAIKAMVKDHKENPDKYPVEQETAEAAAPAA